MNKEKEAMREKIDMTIRSKFPLIEVSEEGFSHLIPLVQDDEDH